MIHTNVEGIFHLTTALLPALRAAATDTNPARIINIGSVDGLRPPVMENYSYSASKAAVHMLTRHLAKRLAREHITVNAIAPGPFESKMTAFMLDSQDAKEMVEQMVPLGRIGRPDDVVGLTCSSPPGPARISPARSSRWTAGSQAAADPRVPPRRRIPGRARPRSPRAAAFSAATGSPQARVRSGSGAHRPTAANRP